MNTKFRLTWAACGLLLGASGAFSQATPFPPAIYSNTDSVFRPMWNETNLTEDFLPYLANWTVENVGTDTVTIVASGARLGGGSWNNLTWKYVADARQPNFEVRFAWRMPTNPSGNSGFNFRGNCWEGTMAGGGCTDATRRVSGPQIDLGPQYNWDIWGSAGPSITQGRYMGASLPSNPPNQINNTGACRTGVVSTQWQYMGFKVLNDTAFTLKWPNGFTGEPTVCAKYLLTLARDRVADGGTSMGAFALQYETVVRSEFRHIRMRNVTPEPVSIAGASQLPHSFYSIHTAHRSLRIDVSVPGKYSVEIADLFGRTLHRSEGENPSHHEFRAKQSGIYLVKISTARGNAFRKVVVR